MVRTARLLGLALMASLAFGCASTGSPGDPFEPMNRKIYSFNTAVDKAVLKPTAQAYKDYIPYVLRYSFHSFVSNIDDIWIGTNNLLQGKPRRAINDWTRVLLNSTFGFLGFSDLASELGYEKSREDFDQTLGVWGVPTGPYIVLPFFGPSSVRGTAGWATDWVLDPMEPLVPSESVYYGVSVTGIIDTRAGYLGASNVLSGAALDEYSFVRDGYFQRRRNSIYDGNPPYEDLDDEPLPTYKD